jgi:serine protease Do
MTNHVGFLVRAAALAAALVLASSAPAQTARSAAQEQRRSPIVAAVEKVGPAVVNISAERLVRRRASGFESFFFDFAPPDRRGYKTESLGSGVIIDPSGIVVTNDHVVSGASRILVTTSDGKEMEAEVLGADADNDLAVLKVEGKGLLRSVKVGTTSDLMIGETVIALGNPFGLSNTVTTGIVSAIHRTVQGEAGRTYSDFIQTDAAINPGNSGGALVNVVGDLIGINTAIVGGANTIGFAIPIDRAKRISDDLLRFGQVKPVWLGMRGSTVSSDASRASARGLGLKIQQVYPESPADRGGVKVGDLLTALDGKPVESREDFDTLLASLVPGKTVELTLRRRGADRTASVTTARLPEDLGLDMLRRVVGMTVTKGRNGLTVADVIRESPADAKGIERGDLVLAVNGQKVTSMEELNREVQQSFGRSGLVVVVARGAYAYTLTFRLE